MLLGTSLVIVGVIGASVFGLAWWLREQRAAVFVFSAIGCVFATLVGVGVFHRSSWFTCGLGIVAFLGLLYLVWGVLIAGLITRGINSMAVRDFEQGRPIRLDGGARVARVGSLILRHRKIEHWGQCGYSVTLSVSLSQTAQGPTEVVLRKAVDLLAAEAVVGGYRIQLVDVAKRGIKSSLLTSTVVVVDANGKTSEADAQACP